jgi:ABC-2 type transport system ATP-binding protein
MLEIIDGEKTYDGRRILHIPSLKLDKGIYWLKGANGSGKTTFLRMVAGLIPFRGDILVDGISLHKHQRDYRGLVSMAEAEPLFPSFVRGSQLMDFYREIRQALKADISKLIDFFGVEPFLNDSIGTYSSGMVKRLSLVLAFIGRPRLILLDEPLATLDAEGARSLPEMIEEYHEHSGTSFILSSHQSIKADYLSIDNTLVTQNHEVSVSL